RPSRGCAARAGAGLRASPRPRQPGLAYPLDSLPGARVEVPRPGPDGAPAGHRARPDAKMARERMIGFLCTRDGELVRFGRTNGSWDVASILRHAAVQCVVASGWCVLAGARGTGMLRSTYCGGAGDGCDLP